MPGEGAVFAALADDTRRGILTAVAADGPRTATSLAAGLPVSRQAVSKHLHLLADVGLVTAERVGRETRWRFRRDPLDEAAAWMEATGAAWDRRLDRLARPPR